MLPQALGSRVWKGTAGSDLALCCELPSMYRFCELISLIPELSLNVFTIGILSGCWNGVRCNRLVRWLLLKPQPRRSLLTGVCLVIMSIYFLSSAHDAQSRWASNFSGHLSFCFTYFCNMYWKTFNHVPFLSPFQLRDTNDPLFLWNLTTLPRRAPAHQDWEKSETDLSYFSSEIFTK